MVSLLCANYLVRQVSTAQAYTIKATPTCEKQSRESLTCTPVQKSVPGTLKFYFLGQYLICATLNNNDASFTYSAFINRNKKLGRTSSTGQNAFLCQQLTMIVLSAPESG